MKYQPPYGISDPNAPYINGNPALGQQGSVPPAAAFEQPMRELVGAIEKSGFITSDNDLLQLAKGIRSQRLNYAVDTGTPNNIVATFDPPFAPGTNPYTIGLVLHVRIRFTTIDVGAGSGLTSINAGAGNVRVRKMNGADLSPGDLPQGAIATLVYDGTGFQLSNFGGSGGGPGDSFFVNIPYAEDYSPLPGIIRVDFDPPQLVPPTAGDIFAVKVANTATGATTMIINGLAPVNLLPNGGGIMLQGDIAANDVMQFFFDGVALRFAPNPDITAPVVYAITGGGGPPPGNAVGSFPTVAAAMDALRRKTIGANGYVTLQMVAGVVQGPIDIAHPSGDRLCVRGAMVGSARPVPGQFAQNGTSDAQRAADAIFNSGYLRALYATEIQVQNRGGTPGIDFGVRNNGPGRVLFADLLITGSQIPIGPDGEWWQIGVQVEPGLGVTCANVSVWGCHTGFNINGALGAGACFASACTHTGFIVSGLLQSSDGGAFGCTLNGYIGYSSSSTVFSDWARANGYAGFVVDSGAGAQLWFITATGNGSWDLAATNAAAAIVVDESLTNQSPIGTTSPPMGTQGNLGAIVTRVVQYRPPA